MMRCSDPKKFASLLFLLWGAVSGQAVLRAEEDQGPGHHVQHKGEDDPEGWEKHRAGVVDAPGHNYMKISFKKLLELNYQ